MMRWKFWWRLTICNSRSSRLTRLKSNRSKRIRTEEKLDELRGAEFSERDWCKVAERFKLFSSALSTRTAATTGKEITNSRWSTTNFTGCCWARAFRRIRSNVTEKDDDEEKTCHALDHCWIDDEREFCLYDRLVRWSVVFKSLDSPAKNVSNRPYRYSFSFCHLEIRGDAIESTNDALKTTRLFIISTTRKMTCFPFLWTRKSSANDVYWLIVRATDRIEIDFIPKAEEISAFFKNGNAFFTIDSLG